VQYKEQCLQFSNEKLIRATSPYSKRKTAYIKINNKIGDKNETKETK